MRVTGEQYNFHIRQVPNKIEMHWQSFMTFLLQLFTDRTKITDYVIFDPQKIL